MSDYRTTTGEPLPTSRRNQRRVRRIWIKRGAWMLLAVVVTGFIIPVKIRVAAAGYVTTDDYAEVRPSTAGRVAKILFSSGQHVKAGDVLVRLDDDIQQADLEEARSAVRQVEAELVQREAQLAQNERQRMHLQSQSALRADYAAVTLKMTEELHAKGLSSGKALEDQKMALTLAEAELANLRDADKSLAEKELAVIRQELEVKRSAVAKAEAQLRARHVFAPISGEVVRYEFVVGELITPDSVLYEVFGGDRLILKLRIPERHATLVTPGAPYKARLSTYTGWGSSRFKGTVSALRSVIQSDNQQSYRMAYCTFDANEHPVPPGTSAEARVTIATVPFWFWMFGTR